MLPRETAERLLDRATDELHKHCYYRGWWDKRARRSYWISPRSKRITLENQINRAANALGLRPVFTQNQGPRRLIALEPLEDEEEPRHLR